MFKLRNLIIALMLIVCQLSFAQPIVQPCYLLPEDQFNVRKIYTTDSDELRERLSKVRAFFASEMKRLGYGEKTFEFSTNIPIYQGRRNLVDYKTLDDIRAEHIPTKSPDDILLVFLVGAKSIQGEAAGVFAHLCREGTNICKEPMVIKPLEGRPEYFNAVIAHELGHAFGFDRHQEGEYLLMSKTTPLFSPGRDLLQDIAIHPETAAVINSSPALSLIGDPPTNNVVSNEKSVQAENIDADVNNDGSVDLSDVLIIRNAIQNSFHTNDTDINNDGKTDEADVNIVKLKAMEAIVAAAPALIRRKKITTWGALKRKNR